MVGSITSGQSFGRLGWYLAGKNPDRVAWTAVRNTSEKNPLEVAKEMSDVAAQSSRVEKPVYHVSISLDPGDELTRKQLEQVADRTLKDLGLDEYQAALVAHNDTEHNHVHMMVNRVHPRTGKAWQPVFSKRRLRQSLERQEKELGVRLTGNNARQLEADRQPSHSITEIEKIERADGIKRGERFEKSRTDHQQDSSKSMEVQNDKLQSQEAQTYSQNFRRKLEAAREDVQDASNPDEMRRGLKKQDLDVETGGQDRAEVVNPDDRSERMSVRDLASAYRKEHLAEETPDAGKNRLGERSTDQGKVVGGDGASKPGKSMEGAATRAGTAVAREALEPMEDESDAMKKAARLIEVAGRVADRLERRRGSGTRQREENRGVGKEERDELNRQIDEGENQLQSYERGQSRIEDARRDVDEALEDVYEDAGAARHKIQQASREQGAAQTAQGLRERPERFGEVQDTSKNRKAAERAADRLQDAAGEMKHTPPASDVQELREQVEKSREQLREIEKHLDDQPEADATRAASRAEEIRRDVQEYLETQEMEAQRRQNTQTINEGERQLSDDDEVKQKLSKAQREFDDNLKRAYKNPSAAKERFHAMADERSRDEAADTMRSDPGQFGKLNEKRESTMMGLSSETSTDEAKRHANVAANRGKTTRQLQARNMSQEARQRLQKKVEDAKEQSTQITVKLHDRASSKSLKKQIGQRLQQMSDKARQSATDQLPKKSQAVARSAMKTVGRSALEATKDKEHGRGHGL